MPIWCSHTIFLGKDLSIEQGWDPRTFRDKSIYCKATSSQTFLASNQLMKSTIIISSREQFEVAERGFYGEGGVYSEPLAIMSFPSMSQGDFRQWVVQLWIPPSSRHSPNSITLTLPSPHSYLTFMLLGIPNLVLGRWKFSCLNSSSLPEWRILLHS